MGDKINRELLIELVRNEPGLWNKWDKVYNNRDLKPDLWDKIGKSLNVTGKMAQKSWETLRDSYRKIRKRAQSGKCGRRYISWPHYSSMCFLDDMLPQQVTPTESYPSPKVEPCAETRDEEDDIECYNQEMKATEEGRRKRRYGDFQEGRKVQILDTRYQKDPYETDDDYLFLMSLHPYLKKLDDVQKMRLRIEILRSVTEELENSKYQEVSASSWHSPAVTMTQGASPSDSSYSHHVTPAPSPGSAPT